jgi:DNA-binding NarL/FixJ family response regulator
MSVDDHPIFRQGLAAALGNDPRLELVAEASTGSQAIACYRDVMPDVTLMDLRLPDITGIETIRSIRKIVADARIVVLTTETGDAMIQSALAVGARGYVLKDMALSELLRIIHAVHAGKTGIPGLVATQLAAHLGEKALSQREVEVLMLVADGLRNKAVAAALAISEETVKMHVKHAMAKLGANDRTHAVTIAIQRGFITL